MRNSDFVSTVDRISRTDCPGRIYSSGISGMARFLSGGPEEDLSQEGTDPLLQQFAAGSEDAFNTLYWEYGTHVLHFAMSFVESRETSEDLCADVFCTFWEMRTRFTHIRNVKAFLFTSIRNACLNYLKTNANRVSRQEEFALRQDYIQWEPTGNASDVRSEYRKKLLKCIEGLPKQCRRVFTMSCFEGMKNNEIANHLGISLRTVKNHKSGALRLLKEAILTNQTFVHLFLVAYLLFRF